LLPETGHQGPQQELLHEAHPRMRRHFEGPQLDQSQPARASFRRIQFVDTELGAVRMARQVAEQVCRLARDVLLFVGAADRTEVAPRAGA